MASSDWHQTGLMLDAAEERWRSIGEDADPELVRRFGAAVAAVRDGLTRHEAERAAEEQLAAERAREVAAVKRCGRACPRCRRRRSRPRWPASGQTGRHWLRFRAETTLRLIARFEAACRAAEVRLARRRWWKNNCSGSKPSVRRRKRWPATPSS